jgi:hypothetical protein
MFLELLRRRNPAFLEAAIKLHQAGEIPGACYVLDYHAMLDQPRPLETGETALFGFRPQIFVTRALVAPIAGVASGGPRCAGVYAADGHQVVWP